MNASWPTVFYRPFAWTGPTTITAKVPGTAWRRVRPALFAAQFALSHAAWLIACPVAGLASAAADPTAAFLVLAVLCAIGTVLGFFVWPAHEPADLPHRHEGLAPAHPHLTEGPGAKDGAEHAHPFVIDDQH